MSLRCGNGALGTGTPSIRAKGSQPSPISCTNRRSAGTRSRTASLWRLKTSIANRRSWKRPANVPSQISVPITRMTRGDGGACVPPASSPLRAAACAAWIVRSVLSYQASGSRTVSRTFASGNVSISCA